MNVEIEVTGGVATFVMDERQGSWQCAREIRQGDFPLIRVVNGKRYELYSDGTFAEVELGSGLNGASSPSRPTRDRSSG